MPAGPVQLTNANGTLQMRQAFDAVVAKIRCVCAAIIQMSGGIPNELEWKVLSDVEFDRFEGLVDAEDIYLASKLNVPPSNVRAPVGFLGRHRSAAAVL